MPTKASQVIAFRPIRSSRTVTHIKDIMKHLSSEHRYKISKSEAMRIVIEHYHQNVLKSPTTI